jgi:hypothetical protein
MVFDRSNGIYRSVIIAIAGLILLGANNPSKNSTGNAPAAQGNQKAGHNENITAGVSRIGSALEAQKPKADSYEKERNEREIRDLQAQENSAYWAEAMFWATIAAIILSVIGIGLVWFTFRETRNAAKSAQISSEAYIWNERAWLEFVDWPKAAGNIRTAPIDAFPMVAVHNSGKSMAKIVRVTAHEVDSGWKKTGCEAEWPVNGHLIKAGKTATLRAFPISLNVGVKKQFIIDVEYSILGGETDCFECRFSMSLIKSSGPMGGLTLEYSK